MAGKKYGLYAVWFYYTDEWSATSGELADFKGAFDSLKEAKAAHKKAELRAFHEMSKLAGKQGSYFYHEDVADSPDLSARADDEELWTWMQKHEVYFHRVVEHKEIVRQTQVVFQPEFWGTKAINYFKKEDIHLLKKKEFPFLNDGYAYLNDDDEEEEVIEEARMSKQQAIDLTIHYLKQFPEGHFLATTYVEDLSVSPALLLSYLRTCQSIQLTTEPVTNENVQKINARLGQLNSQQKLKPGQNFYTLNIPAGQTIDYFEMKGLLPLLKVQPFELLDTYISVNGESVMKGSKYGIEAQVHY